MSLVWIYRKSFVITNGHKILKGVQNVLSKTILETCEELTTNQNKGLTGEEAKRDSLKTALMHWLRKGKTKLQMFWPS